MLNALRARAMWLVFAFSGLAVFADAKPKPLPKPAGFVCQAMTPDGPQMCLTQVEPSLIGTRTPILLIHGWSQDRPGPPAPEMWDNFIAYAATIPWVAEKYKFYRVTYYSNLVSVPDIGQQLATLIDQMDAQDSSFKGKQLFLVGYSLGGLVARSFMQEAQLQSGWGMPGGDRVLRLVTLATPHHGTPLANGPSRDDNAGSLIGWVIDLADNLFFQNMTWGEYNRYDLHDDGYLNSADIIHLDYQRFPSDLNLWLSHLNESNPYTSKMSVYAGSIYTDGDLRGCTELGLQCPARLIKRLYGLESDGIVPSISATARPCDDCVAVEWWFNDYDHYQMVQGLTPDDSYLFGAILGDLSDFVATGDKRFSSSVAMGNPANEAFHNLRGWGEAGQDLTGTFRNLLPDQQTYIDLFVPRIAVPYRLSIKRAGDTCDSDKFYIYVTNNGIDVPWLLLYPGELQCQVVQGNSLYQFQIPDYAITKNKVRLGFLEWSFDSDFKPAPFYYIRLD